MLDPVIGSVPQLSQGLEVQNVQVVHGSALTVLARFGKTRETVQNVQHLHTRSSNSSDKMNTPTGIASRWRWAPFSASQRQ